MTLNIRELIAGDAAQLRFVKRYSIFHVVSPESVAEHCFYTAFYAMWIAAWVEEVLGWEVHVDTLLRRALLHDLEEARTGDILRMFKHRDPETAVAIEKASKGELQSLLSKLTDSRELQSAALGSWEYAKNRSTEGRILQFADFLSVLGYLLQELEFANRCVVPRTEDFRNYVQTFNNEEFNFIRPLIDQVKVIMGESFGDCDAG